MIGCLHNGYTGHPAAVRFLTIPHEKILPPIAVILRLCIVQQLSGSFSVVGPVCRVVA